MPTSSKRPSCLRHSIETLCRLILDFGRLLLLNARSRSALPAENLFLRKQLALFQERRIKPRRTNDSTRWLMVFLGRLFDWRSALVVVKPGTLIRWQRKGFRLFWWWKSRPLGRPRLPQDLQNLIRTMARDNPTWGQARIAHELLLKLGIRVSPRTVARYLPDEDDPGRAADPAQRWLTFVRNHAQAMVACDFFVVVTARFRVLYVFVLMELGTRRILREWIIHYNRGRPHSSLGPGIPESLQRPLLAVTDRHSLAPRHVVRVKPVLGGLHHEYWLERAGSD